jgi:hypothetical protein
MANIITSFTNKLSSTTEKGICTSTDNDSLGFTLLYSRTGENFITSFLTNG